MGVIKMSIQPNTDRFAGIEQTKRGIGLWFVNAADPDGVLYTKSNFMQQYAKLEVTGGLTQTMRLAKVALDAYEDEHAPALAR